MMTIQSNLTTQIQGAQWEALMEENIDTECLRGMEKPLDHKDDGTRHFMNQIWVPKFSSTKNLIMVEAHNTR